MKKVKIALKQFFSSIWEDFKHLVKSHIWRIVGFVVSFLVPIVWLLIQYVQKVDGKTKYSIPFAVILPLVILILIYWGKLKRYISTKVVMMKTENNIEKGKHAGAIIVCDMLKALFVVAPFVVFYILIVGLEKKVERLSDIFLFMIICEALGGLFMILDTIHNVVDYEKEEIEELSEQVLKDLEK